MFIKESHNKDSGISGYFPLSRRVTTSCETEEWKFRNLSRTDWRWEERDVIIQEKHRRHFLLEIHECLSAVCMSERRLSVVTTFPSDPWHFCIFVAFGLRSVVIRAWIMLPLPRSSPVAMRVHPSFYPSLPSNLFIYSYSIHLGIYYTHGNFVILL